MRIEVGTVNKLSQAALALSALAYACWRLAAAPIAAFLPWAGAAEFMAGYGLAALAFAAFPHRRRMDLIKAVILVGALAEIAGYLLGRGYDPLNLFAETGGAVAVLVTSFMERFRSLARAAPHEAFSMVYPNDRRRRSSLRSASPDAGALAGGKAAG